MEAMIWKKKLKMTYSFFPMLHLMMNQFWFYNEKKIKFSYIYILNMVFPLQTFL